MIVQVTERGLSSKDYRVPASLFVRDRVVNVKKPPPAPFLGGAMSGFSYYRPIIINPATYTANYQVRIVLTAETFDYSHCNSDGSDIRFIDSNSNNLDYWIHSWDISGTSIIFVKVPSASTASITMYYGKVGATSQSDGDSVFEFFDSFEDITIGQPPDDSKWAIPSKGPGDFVDIQADPADATKKVLRLYNAGTSGDGPAVITVVPFTQQLAFGWRERRTVQTQIYQYLYEDSVRKIITAFAGPGGATWRYYYYFGGVYLEFLPTTGTLSINTWYNLEELITKTSYKRIILNLARTGNFYEPISDYIDAVAFYTTRLVSGVTYYIDDFFARKYSDVDPAITFGEEGTIAPFTCSDRLVIGQKTSIKSFSYRRGEPRFIFLDEDESDVYGAYYSNESRVASSGDYVYYLCTNRYIVWYKINDDYTLTFAGSQDLGAIESAACAISGDLLFVTTYHASYYGVKSYRIQEDGSLVFLTNNATIGGGKTDCIVLHEGLLYVSSLHDNTLSVCSFNGSGVLTKLDSASIQSPDGAIVFYDKYCIDIAIDLIRVFELNEDGTIKTVASTYTTSGGGFNFGGAVVDEDNGLLWVCNGVTKTLYSFSISADGALTLVDSVTYDNFLPRSVGIFTGKYLVVVGIGSDDNGIYRYKYDVGGKLTFIAYSEVPDASNGSAYILKLTSSIMITTLFKQIGEESRLYLGVFKYIL